MSVVVDRIMQQIKVEPVAPPPALPPPVLSPALTPNELKVLLKDALEVKTPPPVPAGEFHFDSIVDFVAWYVSHQGAFTDSQKVALNTLVNTRMMIDEGCNCKRGTREALANDYFHDFWQNNKTTDMMPTLLQALNVKRVTFGKFLAYP